MSLKQIFKDSLARTIAAVLPPSVMRDRRYHDLWQRRGWHATPADYQSPIPDTRELDAGHWKTHSQLPGIDLALERQVAMLGEFAGTFAPECERFPVQATALAHQFYREQTWLEYLDAAMLHCMVRQYKPRRIIEIGGGFTTFVSAAAIDLNRAEGHACELISIEPYPRPALRQGFPGLTQLIEKPVQQIPLDFFAALCANDILFIDSSHVVRTGGDVLYEYLEIVPRLAPGVLVHAHDILLPAEYFREWIVDRHLFWTEQYLLQAFLAFNTSFEVLWAGSAMLLAHPEAIKRTFPSYNSVDAWPGSFWMRRTG